MSSSESKWHDRALASNIVGGLVVGFLIWGIPAALNAATKAKVPFWVYAVVAIGAILVMSFAIPLWRRAVWGNALRVVSFVWGLRVLSRSQRDRLVTVGFDKREDVLKIERSTAPRPAWRIVVGDATFLEPHINWLHNSGHDVADVEVTCDRTYFEIEGQMFYRGPFGNAGRQLLGLVTERGEAEGIDFRVAWSDANGDRQHTGVRVPAEVLRQRRQAVIDAARADGRREGFTEGVANAKENTHPRSPILPVLPPPVPRWTFANLGADNAGMVTYRLTNSIPGSAAYNARMDVVSGGPFFFDDAGFWSDLSGPNEGTFRGQLQGVGRSTGATLQLSWHDGGAVRHELTIPIAPISTSPAEPPF